MEPYGRGLQEYVIKTRNHPGFWRATAHNVKKKKLKMVIFWPFGPFWGGFPGFVGAKNSSGDVSTLVQQYSEKKSWKRPHPRGLRAQKWAAHFYPLNLALKFTVTVSHPNKVESRARCLNRGNWTLRVQKRCFWDISTPSSGQNWRKTRFFAFFWRFFRVFLNRNSSKHFWLGLWKQKMSRHDS